MKKIAELSLLLGALLMLAPAAALAKGPKDGKGNGGHKSPTFTRFTAKFAAAEGIETSARGFGPIWEAVVRDFHQRHPLGGVRVSMNDMGATPAVVSLRLDQAVSELPA